MATAIERIQAMNAEIVDMDSTIAQARAELDMLTHIDDDAQRDAAVSDRYEDRADAKRTARDVARIERSISSLVDNQHKLLRRRDHEVAKLAAG